MIKNIINAVNIGTVLGLVLVNAITLILMPHDEFYSPIITSILFAVGLIYSILFIVIIIKKIKEM